MTKQNPIDAAKRAMREDMAQRRSALSSGERETGAEALAQAGIAFASPSPGVAVSGYAAIRDELNPLPLLMALAAAGHPVALPVIAHKAAPLTFRAWVPGAPLETGAFSVPVPGEDASEVTPGIVLVPLLAFDMKGHRLGYGAGFYDRTLAGLRARGRVTAIGLAFDVQRLEAVPRDAYDEPLDWVLTPSGPIAIER